MKHCVPNTFHKTFVHGDTDVETQVTRDVVFHGRCRTFLIDFND